MAKQWDSGLETISVAKTSQSMTFNVTFSAAPLGIATMGGATAAKGAGLTNITTTGADIYGEVAEDVNWIARDSGYEIGGTTGSILTPPGVNRLMGALLQL